LNSDIVFEPAYLKSYRCGDLQKRAEDAYNHLVSPTHAAYAIPAAVLIAVEAGMRILLGYNTGGYDSVSLIKLLGGVVDIYMPDMKYANESTGKRFSGIPRYPFS